MDDEIIYSSGNVIITKTLVRIGGISYPINGIGSVWVSKPSTPTFRIVFLVVVGIFAAASFSDPKTVGMGVFFLVIAVVIFASMRGRPSHLVLKTSSGDQQALSSTDVAFLTSVKAAIEQAVTRRG